MLKGIIPALIFLFGLLFLNPFKLYAQITSPDFLWAASAGGFAYDGARDVITDRAGNIIITGFYDVSADFGDTTLITETANTFIAKLDTDGNFIWAKSVLNSGTTEVVTIALDNFENIIIAGSFSGTIQLQTGEQLTSLGVYDVFIIKYSPNGDLIWLARFGDDDDNFVNDISTDNFNNIYFTGYKTFASSADNQIYTAAFSEAGVFQWQRSTSGFGFYDRGTGISVNSLNNIFVTGAFGGTLIFEGSNASTQDSIVISNGTTDIFLARYDLSGNLVLVQNVDNPGYDEGGKIKSDINGDVVLTGITAAVSGADVYLAKYSESGNLVWQTLHAFFPYNGYPKLGLDNGGNISVIFLSNLGESISGGQGEIYFSRFNDQGVNLWNINYGGILVFADPGDLDIDIRGDIVLSGGFTGDGFFGDTSLVSVQGSNDVFVTKVSAPKINFNSSVVNFGDVNVGENFQLQVSVDNSTGTTLYISNTVLIEENQETNFSVLSGLPVDSLPPFQSINIDIQFAPLTAGLKTGYLIFESDAPTSPDTVFLTGTGVVEPIIVNLPDSAVIGQGTTVVANSPGPSYTSNQFFYRRTGERVYQQSQLIQSGNNYIGNIPSGYSTVRGIQFYIVFTDSIAGGTITHPSNNPAVNPASIQVNVPAINFPGNFTSNKYQMISVPLILSNPGLSSVLEDDYGSYDRRFWRLLRWDTAAGRYSEFENINNNFQPGNSFWLINISGQSFDIENSVTVPSNNPYTITVQPGWNQIANPFAFPVAWNDVGNSGLIMQLPARWNPDTEEYEYDQAVLNPWEGYWVYDSLQQIINLSFPPLESTSGLEKNIFKNFSSNSFVVQIKSKIELTGIQDNQNFVGMDEKASDGFDRFDIIEAPPITDNLRLSIFAGGKDYARNIVSQSSEGAYWDLRIISKQNKNINLRFEEKIPHPEDFKIWLIDVEGRHSLPIINHSSTISMSSREEKEFRLIIGTKEYAQKVSDNIPLVPDEYKLYQNFPNPFNPETNIYFTLRENGNVKLEIFDVLGRKIKTLIKEEELKAGINNIKWDGTDEFGKIVSSGIYIYRIKTNNFIDSKKMILLR